MRKTEYERQDSLLRYEKTRVRHFGMLHLQRYDHETNEADARIMEAKEYEILNTLGYPDPYA